MKNKLMHIIIVVLVLIFVGCKGNNQETNFIPVLPPAASEDDLDWNIDIEDVNEPTEIPDNIEDDPEDDPLYVGETTTKYVKLSRYGAILNVRSAPNTEEDNVVGFLVHTEPVEVISIENDWAKFLYHDEIRYVSAEYLVDSVPPYISPPTQIIEGN